MGAVQCWTFLAQALNQIKTLCQAKARRQQICSLTFHSQPWVRARIAAVWIGDVLSSESEKRAQINPFQTTLSDSAEAGHRNPETSATSTPDLTRTSEGKKQRSIAKGGTRLPPAGSCPHSLRFSCEKILACPVGLPNVLQQRAIGTLRRAKISRKKLFYPTSKSLLVCLCQIQS